MPINQILQNKAILIGSFFRMALTFFFCTGFWMCILSDLRPEQPRPALSKAAFGRFSGKLFPKQVFTELNEIASQDHSVRTQITGGRTSMCGGLSRAISRPWPSSHGGKRGYQDGGSLLILQGNQQAWLSHLLFLWSEASQAANPTRTHSCLLVSQISHVHKQWLFTTTVPYMCFLSSKKNLGRISKPEKESMENGWNPLHFLFLEGILHSADLLEAAFIFYQESMKVSWTLYFFFKKMALHNGEPYTVVKVFFGNCWITV